jgi:hypothetical protein
MLNLPRLARTTFDGLQRVLGISSLEAHAEADVSAAPARPPARLPARPPAPS